MQAQRAVGEIESIVVEHLVDSRRVLQVFLLERHHVAIQRLVALHFMPARIALRQVVTEPIIGDQLTNLLLQGDRITL